MYAVARRMRVWSMPPPAAGTLPAKRCKLSVLRGLWPRVATPSKRCAPRGRVSLRLCGSPTHPPTTALVRAEEPKDVEVPAELQAAVDGGNVELVKEMLKTPPAGMSKALVKKLIKNSDIAAKKLEKSAAKGTRPATAPTPAAPKAKATPAGTGSSAAAAGAAAPKAAAAISTGHSTAEDVIVADLLACLKALDMPEGVLARVEAQRGSLRAAIMPRVNALRNSAYAQGFSAKASI